MARWQNQDVDVDARLVPKFLWMTASINVSIGGQRVLSTGGGLKVWGRHKETFTLPDGSFHEAELSWEHLERTTFGYKLSIDGVPVEDSTVRISNTHVMLFVQLLIALGVGAYVMFQITATMHGTENMESVDGDTEYSSE